MKSNTIRLSGGLELLDNWDRAIKLLIPDLQFSIPIEVRPMTAGDVDNWIGREPKEAEYLCLVHDPPSATICVHLRDANKHPRMIFLSIALHVALIEEQIRKTG